ncbi:MAG: ceramidase domain-containing protein [Proteobacteria bacterium]|nr:ceramidase domain-containing protein [Pseudomonadota bacterium]
MLPAIPQDPAYHAFADARPLFGVENFLNVSSNVFFIAAGLMGLQSVLVSRSGGLRSDHAVLRQMYSLLFIGLIITGLGSGWYHLLPDNVTLMWDRLPMTLSFMAFFSIVITERAPVSWGRKWGKRMLWALIVAGFCSVFYWAYTEDQQQGDLRLYVLVQFLPALLIPFILLLYPARYPGDRYFWFLIACNVLSKLFEHWDSQIYSLTDAVVSGHSLKHVVAALGGYFMYKLWRMKGT